MYIMNVNKLLRFATMFYSIAAGEELPENSDDLKTILSNIDSLDTYAARKKYAEKNLEHLSSGSSRITYLTGDETVVKMAKNDRGIAQNEAEKKAAFKCDSKHLNEVLRSANNNAWIEVPYLEKITEKDFKELTNLDFADFGEAIRFSLKGVSNNSDTKKPKNYDEVSKSDLFKELTKIGKKLDLMPGDLARISSFGAKDGCVVLADSGLTKKVYEDFYEDSTS